MSYQLKYATFMATGNILLVMARGFKFLGNVAYDTSAFLLDVGLYMANKLFPEEG